jgi:hypothetical protein
MKIRNFMKTKHMSLLRRVKMKNGLWFLLVGLMIVSCVSYKAAYDDESIVAELLVEDSEWVILTIRNNTASPIQLLTDKAFYSNPGTYENTTLVPLLEDMNAGTKVVPIPVPPGRTVSQKFIPPAAIVYRHGKKVNTRRWTPRGKYDIQTASFTFEYEIDGETRSFMFEAFYKR